MKKMLLLVLCVGLVPMFAADAVSANAQTNPFSTAPVLVVPIDAAESTPARTYRYDDSLYYGNLIWDNAIGLSGGGTFEWAIRLTSAELGPYAGWKMVAMKFHHNTGNLDNNIYIYDEGTPTSPGAVLLAEPYTSNNANDWVFIPFSDSIDINGSTDLWVSVEGTHASGTYPASCDAGPSIDGKGGWINLGGWDEIQNYGFDVNWLIVAFVEPAGGPAPFWDFETGWQGWTHTSGNTFPAAWGVVETTYPGGPYWTYQPPPDAGDSAFIIDSDSAGSGTWVVDTAMSPVIYNEGYSLLKWGFYLENDELQVLLREWDGSWGAWNVVASYSGDTGPAWDSADVSGYAGDSLQCAFQYDDGDAWLYGATFDNVGFYMGADVDVGASDIASPAATILPDASITPTATYNNYGSMQETFDCYFAIDSSGTNIYNETASVMLDPGADTTIMWPTWTSGPDGVTYDVMAYTVLAGDQNPGNDTLAMTSTTTSWLYWDDGAPANAWAWTYALNGWGVQFMAPDTVYVDSFAVYIYDASWPTPGSDLSTFRIYDGASEPTNIRQEWIDATIVRGAWNKFPTDTTLTQFGTGENIYMMWFQPADYPNTPGLACDAAIDYGAYQWWYNDPDTWGTGALSGDWMIRVHIVAPPEGISEWIDYTPNELSMSVAGISRNSIAIRFTLPHTSMTNLVLYDATGRRLETLVSNTLNAGIHQYTTDLDLAAGVYFVTLTTDNETITQKSLIVK